MKDNFSFLDYKNNKSVKVTFKCTIEQREVLHKLAKLNCKTLSAYLLYLAEKDLKEMNNKEKK